MDAKVVQVALNGLENLLRVGEQDARAAGAGGVNAMAMLIEECYGKWIPLPCEGSSCKVHAEC